MAGTNTLSAGPTFSRIETSNSGVVHAVYTATLNAPTGQGQPPGAVELWFPLTPDAAAFIKR